MSSIDVAPQPPTPTALGSDLATFAISALLPVVAGLLLLDAYVVLGFLGVFVASVGLLVAGVTWRGVHGAMIPAAPKASHVFGLGVVALFLGLLTSSLVS